jgi:cytochrome c-type biogenesis protein CcmE
VTADGTRRAVASRWRLLAVVLVAAAGTGVLAMSGLEGTTVYYRTPAEIATARPGEHVRLGGMVQEGTVRGSGEHAEFVLTDGTSEVLVAASVALPRVFTEGEGAVVEGTLGADGVFRADRVMVRHSNEYRAPEAGS